jgi:hypothetical protein
MLTNSRACIDRNGLPHRPPLLLKLAPDLADEDLDAIAAVAMAAPVDGIILSNTTGTCAYVPVCLCLCLCVCLSLPVYAHAYVTHSLTHSLTHSHACTYLRVYVVFVVARPATLQAPGALQAEAGGLSGRPLLGPSTDVLEKMYRRTRGSMWHSLVTHSEPCLQRPACIGE